MNGLGLTKRMAHLMTALAIWFLAHAGLQAPAAAGPAPPVSFSGGLLTATSAVVSPAIHTVAFTNPSLITIPTIGAASPYPSAITISGLDGSLTKVVVGLNTLTHSQPADLKVLLVSPTGRKVLVISDVGGSCPLRNASLSIDDNTPAALPQHRPTRTTTGKPANVGANHSFRSSIPAGPTDDSLSVLRGLDPNGTWALYVVDGGEREGGTIAGGWTLTLGVATTNPAAPASAPSPVPADGAPAGEIGVAATTMAPLGWSYELGDPADPARRDTMLAGSVPAYWRLFSVRTASSAARRIPSR